MFHLLYNYRRIKLHAFCRRCETFNSIERFFQGRCCGAVDFEDWRNSMWWQNANNDTDALNQLYMMHVPDFCCRTITPNCGQSDHPSNIFYKVIHSWILHIAVV